MELLTFLISVLELVVVGLLVLMLPRVTRRGLLFGVYVGTDAAAGAQAQAITRSWYRGMAVAMTVCVAAALAFWWAGKQRIALLLPDLILLAGLAANYLRAHQAARALVRIQDQRVSPPPAVASLGPSEPNFVLPAFTLLIGAAVGMVVVWYAWSHYDMLPDRIPVHFTGGGTPDAWSNRSFGTVMVLPLTALATGVGMGALAFLLARAKRALRLEKEGVSLSAQQRYRTAIVRYLCVLTLLVTAMLAIMSIGSVQVGLGEVERLHPSGMILAAAVALWAIGGAIYIAVRVGQGGARLETSVAHAPLTDGLADNEKWKLGVVYINRHDPSIFVEHRFGLGYTVNFGNPKAVAFLVILLAALVVIPLWLSFSQ